MASTLGRAAAKGVRGVWLSELFHAATIGGAKALGRDDIGRIGVGAKADLVLLDLDAPGMRPVRDPLRSFFFSAGRSSCSSPLFRLRCRRFRRARRARLR